MYRILPIILIASLYSCSGESEQIEDRLDLDQTYDELTEDINGPVWELKTDTDYFEIEIPTQMMPKENLNPEASLQYFFLEETDSMVHEHFIIVLVEEYPEDKDMSDSVDIVGFSEAYIDSLMIDREYNIMNEPAVEIINDLDATIHELQASIYTPDGEEIGIYYMLGVYKGKRALYQVLTWTLMDQKELFRGDMRHMLYSFKEI